MKTFKKREDFTPEEEVAYLRDRTVPEIDEEERAGLEAAGFDPDTRRPLVEVEAERDADTKAEARRDELEAMSPDEHAERQREASA